MPVKRTIPYLSGTYFITFTCHQWLPLIEKTNGYDIVYKWFDHLKSKDHFLNGYVIMPNHVHTLISFTETSQDINTIVGNGKRFMAYDLVNRLQLANESDLLKIMSSGVAPGRRSNKKKHNVWELSFDWKQCLSIEFMMQKLDYIHKNPCKGKWNLCESPVDYLHSSAKFYLTGEQGFYPVTNIMEMQDLYFDKRI